MFQVIFYEISQQAAYHTGGGDGENFPLLPQQHDDEIHSHDDDAVVGNGFKELCQHRGAQIVLYEKQNGSVNLEHCIGNGNRHDQHFLL